MAHLFKCIHKLYPQPDSLRLNLAWIFRARLQFRLAALHNVVSMDVNNRPVRNVHDPAAKYPNIDSVTMARIDQTLQKQTFRYLYWLDGHSRCCALCLKALTHCVNQR